MDRAGVEHDGEQGEPMRKSLKVLAVASALALAAPLSIFAPAAAQDAGASETVFKGHCAGCHEPPIERAPSRAQIGQRFPAQIKTILTEGIMAPMATGLSKNQIQALAAYLGTPPTLGSQAKPPFDATIADVVCTGPSAIVPGPSSWGRWGVDDHNTRFQPNPGLTAADVPRLKVKWAFSYAGPVYGQPTVVGDYLFLTSRGGAFYALDARTGCVHWRADKVSSRTAPVVIKSNLAPSGWTVFVADSPRTVSAFDAMDGKKLWTSASLEDHPSTRLTGTPSYHDGLLFVPISSFEETTATRSSYSCCTFRGSLVALDARTGKLLWKHYVISEPFRPLRKNAEGVQVQGPAGGAIWSAPTIDAKRGLVLVSTGDSYTEAPTSGADAIIAIDMKTGRERWRTQVMAHDDYIVGCARRGPSTNCPPDSGPDFDFGAPPILYSLPNGKEIVLSGQKSGIVYGMDPDTGRLLWKTKVGVGSSLGGIEWGLAADRRYVYAPNSDLNQLKDEELRAQGKTPLLQDKFYNKPEPGLTALDPATGKVVWHVRAPASPCHWYGDRDPGEGCYPANAAPATAMPGVVFSGTLDGWLRAYDSLSGKPIWAFSTTAQTYDTTNGVKGQPGGSLDGTGPTIANGSLYMIAGYNGSSSVGGNGTNVLLAFTVDGK
jgi:polyvinyl alcohol dehydrogenase (cytochrome)